MEQKSIFSLLDDKEVLHETEKLFDFCCKLYNEIKEIRQVKSYTITDPNKTFSSMRILQLSDTHNRHRLLTQFPTADVIIHCGDFTDNGTEEEVLDFLNRFVGLPYPHKISVTGNHDLCLWDADGIEKLPPQVHFLQDSGCEIDGIRFFRLAHNHPEALIPNAVDVLITHEPLEIIFDSSGGIHWGNVWLRERVLEIYPRYHLYGYAHGSYGMIWEHNIVFSNRALADDKFRICHLPRLLVIST